MTPDKLAVARSVYESREHTVVVIAKVLGVSRASVYRHLKVSTGNRTARNPSTNGKRRRMNTDTSTEHRRSSANKR